MVVRGRAGRLQDEDVAAAHVLVDHDLDLAVAEATDLRLTERDADVATDRVRERTIGVPREYLDLVFHRLIPASWAGRTRTFAAGSKVRCLSSLATAQEKDPSRLAKAGMLGASFRDVN